MHGVASRCGSVVETQAPIHNFRSSRDPSLRLDREFSLTLACARFPDCRSRSRRPSEATTSSIVHRLHQLLPAAHRAPPARADSGGKRKQAGTGSSQSPKGKGPDPSCRTALAHGAVALQRDYEKRPKGQPSHLPVQYSFLAVSGSHFIPIPVPATNPFSQETRPKATGREVAHLRLRSVNATGGSVAEKADRVPNVLAAVGGLGQSLPRSESVRWAAPWGAGSRSASGRRQSPRPRFVSAERCACSLEQSMPWTRSLC